MIAKALIQRTNPLYLFFKLNDMAANTPGNLPETTVTGTGRSKKGNVPKADTDFGSLAATVSEMWLANSWLTLQWLSAADFAANAGEYSALLSRKASEGGGRAQITGRLAALDARINTSLGYVKGYLAEKYGKKAAPG